jgi:Putative auto-transporter adhesin, head GIN domain
MSASYRWIGRIAYGLLGCVGLWNVACVQQAVTGSGVSASETRQVAPFSAIELDGAADMDVAIADHTEVIVTADDNLLKLIETANEGKTLIIRQRKNLDPKSGIHVYLKTPSLDQVTVNGVSNVSITDLKAPALALNLDGAGSLAAKGQVDKLNVTLNGAGTASLTDLAAQNTTIELNGAGDASINTAATLDVNIAGAGNVFYKGSPTIRQSVAGVGSVSKIK